jgi:hypothetical protein
VFILPSERNTVQKKGDESEKYAVGIHSSLGELLERDCRNTVSQAPPPLYKKSPWQTCWFVAEKTAVGSCRATSRHLLLMVRDQADYEP